MITAETAEICLYLRRQGKLWPEIKSHINYQGESNNLGHHIRKYERTGQLPKITKEEIIPIERKQMKEYSEKGYTKDKVAALHKCSTALVAQKCTEYCMWLAREKPEKKPRIPLDKALLESLALQMPPLSNKEIGERVSRSKDCVSVLVREIRQKRDEAEKQMDHKAAMRLALGFKQ